MADTSRWAVLFGILAVGMKTSMRSLEEVGSTAVPLTVAETVFIAVSILGGLHLIG